MSEDKNPFGIDVGASAKYERKTSVSIEVPEDVTRSKAKALLDAISPFTGSLGIVGDWLADKRIELRAQRGQRLILIASKAQQALESQSVAPGPVPIKALLPMLEKASLEEGDDETLTDAWAALLASASVAYDPEVLTFTRILSELGPREALVLHRLYGGREVGFGQTQRQGSNALLRKRTRSKADGPAGGSRTRRQPLSASKGTC
jgi:hypothetical protein